MCFKLARGNIKKSFKDYTIYFLTLILAVCIFYSFNSMDSQKAVIEMKTSTADSIAKLTEAMGYVSVFVSIILGSLILYANNFLIKRRKKELGIYMTLGMGKRRISKVLVTETLLVGVLSLVVGLILGVAISQGLAAFTLKLFDVGIEEYGFAISIGAIGKTILYFGIMFLLVMIFNVFLISKYKIIDLLTAGRKNETMKFKNPFIYLIGFILCVVALGFAYTILLNAGVDFRNPMLKVSIGLLIIGTVLFFFSLAGVILYIVNKNKKIYFKSLNIFVVKQINSKVNTNFISMSIICLMLFITISVLSIAIGVKKDFEVGLKQTTPFDASIIVFNNKEGSIEAVLDKINFKESENEKYAILNKYISEVRVGELLKTIDEVFKDYVVSFIKISEYNKMLKIKGEKEVELDKQQVLIMSDFNKFIKPINERLKSHRKVNIQGKEYEVKNTKAIEENLYTDSNKHNSFTIVINDEFLGDNVKVWTSVLNVMYSDENREENNKKYKKLHEDFMKGQYKSLKATIQADSKDECYFRVKRGTTGILFVAMYIGIVFLITSMAVLAIQQLSEASDSIEGYKALKRIGANRKMINKTIFTQTLVYFSLPVLLALVHSIVGIIVVYKEISRFNQIDIKFSVFITILVFLMVYIGYFYTTYSGYKSIVKSSI